ncbi:fimbrial biogenesis chaperone [Pantoea allii]|uniref:Fimbrial chaperone protein n=1 Tax=Pantoea allii TaxID=574096 RepID=A0A2V2BJJ2_9GAMM|nr:MULTISPECIES: molecular chaperone [Pantoea]MBW1216174.1 molecular chaperone [Pantoea allii]MBW1252067.1 molecular chaperone [Pantoea allii]MBW1258831.1 molecular chaperone [Pantoea allii]MBW1263904.1 molecular chaperone [Pantoea allii]MBW1267916.1 molecular chaperone [Pantoea allii]
MYIIRFVLYMALLCASLSVNAGGIGVGATRVIYNENAKQASLSVTNTDTAAVYLIQSWVEDDASNKSNDFVLTPPLFIIQPNKENLLRIIFSGEKRPSDRETLYWLNVKAIPSQNNNTEPDSSSLQFAIVSRLKLFYRPNNLPLSSSEAIKKLQTTRQDSLVTFNNPTPYYINVANIKSKNQFLETRSITLAPFGKTSIDIAPAKEMTYQVINDYGGMEPVVHVR